MPLHELKTNEFEDFIEKNSLVFIDFWAHHGEDILWRRTKLGLNFSPQSIKVLTEYLLHKKQ